MDRPTPIVLVTGPPASGKTFVARLLADRLALPRIEKDAIKETLFDSLGTGDVAWSKRLGRATTALVLWALEVHLEARAPAVVESNFAPDDARPALRALAERHPLRPLELHCTAPADVLLERFRSRSGTRHPGHLDAETMPHIASAIAAGRYRPLGLSEDLVVVDTTSFEDVDVEALVDAAGSHLATGVAGAS